MRCGQRLVPSTAALQALKQLAFSTPLAPQKWLRTSCNHHIHSAHRSEPPPSPTQIGHHARRRKFHSPSAIDEDDSIDDLEEEDQSRLQPALSGFPSVGRSTQRQRAQAKEKSNEILNPALRYERPIKDGSFSPGTDVLQNSCPDTSAAVATVGDEAYSPGLITLSLEQWEKGLSCGDARDALIAKDFEVLRSACQSPRLSVRPALCHTPTSYNTLARTAVDLHLSSLLSRLCDYAREHDFLRDLLPDLVQSLSLGRHTAFLKEAIAIVLNSLNSFGISETTERPFPLELRTLDLRLRSMIIGDRDDVRQSLDAVSLESSQLATFQTAFEDFAKDFGVDPLTYLLQTCMEDAVRSGSSERAVLLLKLSTTSKSLKRSASTLSTLLKKLFDLCLDAGEFRTCIQLLPRLAPREKWLTEILHRMWMETEEYHDFLQLFYHFDLQGNPIRRKKAKLLQALATYASPDVLYTELYGTRARMWAGVVSQHWEHEPDPHEAIREFWSLQTAVGRRPLSAIMYDTLVRICRRNEMRNALDALSAHRVQLMKECNNTETIGAILQAARTDDWARVFAQIDTLKVSGFGIMQTQTRVQLFDPLMDVFASSDRPPKDVLGLASMLYARICEPLSPVHEVLLLVGSLVRVGRVEMAKNVHQYANTILDNPMQLAHVDATNLVANYYYGFRPSLLGLARVMADLYQRKWSTASRLWLPMLLKALSFDTKMSQQPRMVGHASNWLQKSLMLLDKPHFREQALKEAAMSPAPSQIEVAASSHLQAGQSEQATSKEPYVELAQPLKYEASRLRAPAGDLISAVDVTGTADLDDSIVMQDPKDKPVETQEPREAGAIEEEPQRSGGLDALMDFLLDESTIDRNDELYKLLRHTAHKQHEGDYKTPAVGSREAHYGNSKGKALMHASAVNKRSKSVALYFDRSPLTNPVGQDASGVSIATARFLEDKRADLAKAFLSFAEKAGADVSLSKVPYLIDALLRTRLDKGKASHVSSIEKLKSVVLADYQRIEESGHLPNHSLATGLANVMLRIHKPKVSVDILRFAFQTPWAALAAPGMAPMYALLRAYIALARMDGVQWVVDLVLARNERIDQKIMRVLRNGRQLIQNQTIFLPEPKRTAMIEGLEDCRAACMTRQKEQLERAKRVGKELAQYIAEFSEAPPALSEDTEQRDPSRRQTKHATAQELRVDAHVANFLCRDIIRLSSRSRSDNRRRPGPIRMDDFVIPRLIAAEYGKRRAGRSELADQVEWMQKVKMYEEEAGEEATTDMRREELD